jgi:hypothetical protein
VQSNNELLFIFREEIGALLSEYGSLSTQTKIQLLRNY